MRLKKQVNSVCVFFSSPHKNGYTKKLLDIFMKQVQASELVIIDCYEKNVKPCIDCGYCKTHRACVFNDIDDIDRYLKKMDLLIFASPVYNFSFPAPMKSILDRMQRYFCARFYGNIKPVINKQKKAVLLASCGSKDELQSIKIMQMQLNKIFTIINCKLVGSILMKETDKLVGIPENIIVQIKELVNNL